MQHRGYKQRDRRGGGRTWGGQRERRDALPALLELAHVHGAAALQPALHLAHRLVQLPLLHQLHHSLPQPLPLVLGPAAVGKAAAGAADRRRFSAWICAGRSGGDIH